MIMIVIVSSSSSGAYNSDLDRSLTWPRKDDRDRGAARIGR